MPHLFSFGAALNLLSPAMAQPSTQPVAQPSVQPSSVSAFQADAPRDVNYAPERQITIFGGVNDVSLLGSEDPRRGAGFGVSFSRYEPKANLGRLVGRVRIEGYYLGSTSPGPYEFEPDRTDALGVFVAYRLQSRERFGYFGELGFGVQQSSQASHDIPLEFNTTPLLGLGLRYNTGGRSYELGFRYLHVSNGGRREPNGGQNWLLGTFSVSF